MNILGINAGHGEASAALLRDGELVAAVAEERFNGVRRWAGFPAQAIRHCLQAGGIDARQLDHVAFAHDPRGALHRRILLTLTRRPSYKKLLVERLAEAARIPDLALPLAAALGVEPGELRAELHRVEHHRAHLASAFFVSPFPAAALCSYDRFGDLVSTAWGQGEGNRLEVQGQVEFPHSLGLLYTAFSQWLGLLQPGDEEGLMQLAPTGEPRYLEQILGPLLQLHPDGGFTLALSAFNHGSEGLPMVWGPGSPSVGPQYGPGLLERFGPPRAPDAELTRHHRDVAASVQRATEVAALHLLTRLQAQTAETRLALAGGVAGNARLNGRICAETPFCEVWVQPAAGDEGLALGAACWVWHQELGQPRRDSLCSAAWGPGFDSAQVEAALGERHDELQGLVVERITEASALAARVARELAGGRVCGWFQGRLELGGRALGQRSVLADPRRAEMRAVLDARGARREVRGPYPLAILAEALAEYCAQGCPSPHGMLSLPIRPERRGALAAACEVDGHARLQTVSQEVQPQLHAVLAAFARETGVPALLNTSLDPGGRAVVSPQQALELFLMTDLDVLVMEDWYLART